MQNKNRYRVAQCSVGVAGSRTLPLILDHPELELVSVWAHTPDRKGVDVGTFIGREPVGIEIIGDFEAIVSADVDCVIYHSETYTRESEAQKDLIRLLSAGKNVVVPWLAELHYPRAGARYAGEFIAKVEAACASGQSSLIMTGTCPGFCTALLPVIMSGAAANVTSIRAQELLDYTSYNKPILTAPEVWAFGHPLDIDVPSFVSPKFLVQGWGTTPAILAASLGYDLEETEFFEHRAPAVNRFEFDYGGIVEPGTIGARWFGLSGKIPDGPELVLEHFTWIGSSENVPADWPVSSPVKPGYRVLVEGYPSMDLHLTTQVDGNDYWGAYAVTATTTTNIVPAVCKAPPGIVSLFDLTVGDLTCRRPPA